MLKYALNLAKRALDAEIYLEIKLAYKEGPGC